MSEDQLLEYQIRQARFAKKSEPCKDEADEGLECELDKKIANYCRDKGWYHFHDRSRGINKAGNPDWIICMPKGRTIWIECKAANGRLSEAQKTTITQLLGLGHEIYEVRSFKRFLEIIEG